MALNLKLTKSEIQEILDRFGLQATAYEPFAGGAANSSFLIDTSQDQFVLTAFETVLARVAVLPTTLQLLEDHQFPATRFISLLNGDQLTNWREHPVMLKRYITGEVVEDLDESMIAQIGAAIGQLHRIPAPDYLPQQSVYWQDTIPQLINAGVNPEYENWLVKRNQVLTQQIPSGLPRGLVHGDLFYDNVLFQSGSFKAIIDFEDASNNYKVFDLGMAAVGLCASDQQVNLSKLRALIAGYQRTRILDQNERDSLQLFISYAAVGTSAWRFWLHIIEIPNPEKANHYQHMVNISKHISAIPHDKFQQAVFQKQIVRDNLSYSYHLDGS
jgi:homoserine kinase type II